MKTTNTVFAASIPRDIRNIILACLLINPIVFHFHNQAGAWLLLVEFIFCLSQVRRAYPFVTGGILAVEALGIGMVSSHTVAEETTHNISVLLLVLFMVPAVHMLSDFLSYLFTQVLVKIKHKTALSIIFFCFGSFLSAFSDALTVMAAVLSMIGALYLIYHKVQSGKDYDDDHTDDDSLIQKELHRDINQFRAFLVSLLMCAAIGTVAGGVATRIGEPQNIPLAEAAGWNFVEFMREMKSVTILVNIAGIFTCFFLTYPFSNSDMSLVISKLDQKIVEAKRDRAFGWWLHIFWLSLRKSFASLLEVYRMPFPKSAMQILKEYNAYEKKRVTKAKTFAKWGQALSFLFLILGLAYHIAEPYVLAVIIIIVNAWISNKTSEHAITKGFHDALGFIALLLTFFVVVGAISDQGIFTPIIAWVLRQPVEAQPLLLFGTSGTLSAGSDNVFVALTHIPAVKQAYELGLMTKEHYWELIRAINVGTNIPSIATPNGQAAFIFIIMSTVASQLRLSYKKMLVMALPFTIVLTIAAIIALVYF